MQRFAHYIHNFNIQETNYRGQWESGGRFSSRLTRHLYGKQTQEGRYIFGGDRIPHPTHRPGLIHPLPRFPKEKGLIECNKKHASEILPLLEDLDIERTWGGIMPFSKDGLPIIGKLEDSETPLYVCTGMGGSGFCRGPAAGILLGSFIADGRSHSKLKNTYPYSLLEFTNPNRFVDNK